MNNLNKFTKAELISKFKKLDNSSPYVTKQTLFQRIMENIFYFKSLILKLTLFTFLIKTFRKYSFFRRIWVIINTIVMTIFGISILDFYGISIIASFYTEFALIVGSLVNYLTNTHFYSVLSGLFGTKVEIDKPSSILRSNNQSSIGDKESSKINQWFNKQEIIEDDSNNRKYYIIAALLLLSCLTWYYYGDDIKPIINTGIEKVKTFRRRPEGDGNISPSSINSDLPKNSWSDSLQNLKNKLKDKIWKDTDRTNLIPKDKAIELIDNTQAIASSSKVKSPDSMDHYFPLADVKGKDVDLSTLSTQEINRRILEQSTGNSLNRFQDESSLLLSRINHFTSVHENDNFPNETIKLAMYSTLKARLVALSVLNATLYSSWLRESNVSTIVNNFFNLKDSLINKVEEQPIESYNDVALSTVEEQDAWSSEPNSSIHSPYVEQEIIQPLSPLQKESEEQILQDDLQALSSLAVEEQPKSMLSDFLNELDNVGFGEGIGTNLMPSEDSVRSELPTSSQIMEQELIHDLAQIDNKVENPKYKIPKVKTSKSEGIFSNWMEEIRSKRKDEHVVEELNIKPEGSSSEESIDHYLPNPEDIKIPNVKIDSPQEEISNIQETIENVSETPKSPLSTILETVKSLFTPKNENKDLTDNTLDESRTLDKFPSTTNLQRDTDALFDDSDVDPIFDWSKVDIENHDKSKFTKIKFDQTWRSTKTIYFSTNNNHLFEFEFDHNWLNADYSDNKRIHFSRTFNWKDKVGKDIFPLPTEIKEIIIEDLNNKNHSVYKNTKWFK